MVVVVNGSLQYLRYYLSGLVASYLAIDTITS